MKRLIKNQKADMEEALSVFRDLNHYKRVRSSLQCLPFPNSRTLFGLSEDGRLPCFQFGEQLVYKIVDELLD